jgi:hypothetical protein
MQRDNKMPILPLVAESVPIQASRSMESYLITQSPIVAI